MFVLLLLPGAGDELQGIKRGVMELVDLVAVNKCDGELAAAGQRTVAEFSQALRLMPSHTIDWTVPVMGVSALTSEGIDDMLETIMRFGACVLESGARRERRGGGCAVRAGDARADGRAAASGAAQRRRRT